MPPQVAWEAWNNPEDIKQWNAASADGHTTASTVDLRVGGRLSSRMEARDGSMGFDFVATYTKVEAPKVLAFRLDDNREVAVESQEIPEGTLIRETFDAETENDPDMQRQGWQAILDNFVRHVEAKTKSQGGKQQVRRAVSEDI